MICPTCDGSGQPLKKWLNDYDSRFCELCSGHGVIHCCEGDQVQPERTEVAKQDA